MVLLNIISFFSPVLYSNVAVGVVWSDVPTPGRLQSFHQGAGTVELCFFGGALDIIVAPLCYKKDTLLCNLIL